MLVLTRSLQEKIVINDNIVVTLISIGNGKVRLGIEAPKEVTVHRQEVHDKLVQEQIAADASTPVATS